MLHIYSHIYVCDDVYYFTSRLIFGGHEIDKTVVIISVVRLDISKKAWRIHHIYDLCRHLFDVGIYVALDASLKYDLSLFSQKHLVYWAVRDLFKRVS
jgi:hypothetical protein